MASAPPFSLESLCQSARPAPTILSSVGGFSQPIRRQIRSLQDVLAVIELLGIKKYRGVSLKEEKFLGEGISYRVFKCKDKVSRVDVAVKRVKLPPGTFGNSEVFDRQLACILRDIEVMSYSPLLSNPHILRLYGYGWDVLHRGPIPFLVTEYATYGTLRKYLKSKNVDGSQKLKLCENVVAGLHALHLSGIVHGDLKLDNVLVAVRPDNLLHIAKISDFGHSLQLTGNDEEYEQSYRGTLAYNAPELYEPGKKNWILCDIWALGLLCWETIGDGSPYYEYRPVQEILLLSETESESRGVTSSIVSRSSAELVSRHAAAVRSRLAEIGEEYIEENLEETFPPATRERLTLLLKRALEVNPKLRVNNVAHFGLLLPVSPRNFNPESQTSSTMVSAKAPEWVFKYFRPAQMAQIPDRARKLIFEDWLRKASGPVETLDSARAALQVGLSYATGFGVVKDHTQSLIWMQNSATKGLYVAELFRDLLAEPPATGARMSPRNGVVPCPSRPSDYTQSLQAGFRKFPNVPYLIEESTNSSLTYDEVRGLLEEEDHRSSSFFLHTAVILGTTGTAQVPPDLNFRDPQTGESALLLACRLGDFDAFKNLLDAGAAYQVHDSNNCCPLHWIFMFQPEEIDFLLSLYWPQQLIDLATNKPIHLDPQHPLELIGTPLHFAISAGSERALHGLLVLGVKYMSRMTIEGNAYTGPMRLAACLHQARMLRGLALGFQDSVESEFSHGSLGISVPESSTLERRLIHGGRCTTALEETASVVSEIASTFEIPWRAVEAAIILGDIEVARAMVPENTTINWKHGLVGILFLCARSASSGNHDINGWLKLLEFAVSIGADVNSTNEDQPEGCVINIAIEHHREDIMDWLIEKGADLNAQDGEGKTPLHHMILTEFSTTVPLKKLLSRGSDPNIQDHDGYTPLHLAAEAGRWEDVEELLEHGASPSLPTRIGGLFALHAGVRSGSSQVVSAILKHEVSPPDRVSGAGRTALVDAVWKGFTDIAEMLLDAGADPAATESRGRNALHFAAANHSSSSISLLLGKKMDVNCVTFISRDTPLHLAIKSIDVGSFVIGDFISSISELAEAGADIGLQDSDGSTVLHLLSGISSSQVRQQAFEAMVRSGLDIDQRPTGELPWLFKAVSGGDLGLVKTLAASGALLEEVNNSGLSVLHLTVSKEHLPGIESVRVAMAATLVNAGANPLRQDHQGMTPLDLAIVSESADCVSIILEHLRKSANARAVSQEKRYHPVYARDEFSLDCSQAIEKSWRFAVDKNRWSSVTAFIQAGVAWDMTILKWPVGLKLFRHGLEQGNQLLMLAFMGEISPDQRSPKADPTLSLIWQDIKRIGRLDIHRVFPGTEKALADRVLFHIEKDGFQQLRCADRQGILCLRYSDLPKDGYPIELEENTAPMAVSTYVEYTSLSHHHSEVNSPEDLHLPRARLKFKNLLSNALGSSNMPHYSTHIKKKGGTTSDLNSKFTKKNKGIPSQKTKGNKDAIEFQTEPGFAQFAGRNFFADSWQQLLIHSLKLWLFDLLPSYRDKGEYIAKLCPMGLRVEVVKRSGVSFPSRAPEYRYLPATIDLLHMCLFHGHSGKPNQLQKYIPALHRDIMERNRYIEAQQEPGLVQVSFSREK